MMGWFQSKPLDQPLDQPVVQPWREVDWRQRNNLLRFVQRYKPKKASHLRVLLYGPVGVGKSSFINTMASVIKGTTVSYAAIETADSTAKSLTTTYQTHKLRTAGGKQIRIVFNDIMGLEAGVSDGVRPEDIKLAMEGHVKDGYKFDPKTTMSPGHEKYNKSPTVDDKVHVLVCLLNANMADISSSVLGKMREIKEAARDLRIPQLMIVTHIDELCDETEENVKNVYRSIALKEKMEHFSSKVGIPLTCVFPVRNNYEGPDQEAVDVLFLTVLKHIVNFGDDYFFNTY